MPAGGRAMRKAKRQASPALKQKGYNSKDYSQVTGPAARRLFDLFGSLPLLLLPLLSLAILFICSTPHKVNTDPANHSNLIMEDRSFDGAFFLSLSLDETFRTAPPESEAGDDMEIDEGFYTPEPEEPGALEASTPDWRVWAHRDFAVTPRGAARDDDFETATEGLDHDTLISALLILLPTALGARFALEGRSGQKMLMAPPRDASELPPGSPDASLSPITHLRQISGFLDPSPEAASDEFTYNPRSGEYDLTPVAAWDALPGLSARSGALLGLSSRSGPLPAAQDRLHRLRYPSVLNSPLFNGSVWNGTPIQVHHHHYYSLPRSKQALPRQPRLPARPSLQQKLALVDAPLDDDTFDVALPQPWQRHLSPHERVPYILSSYVQLLLNVAAAAFAAHLLYAMVTAVRRDIGHKTQQQVANTLSEIATCERMYRENHCAPETVVPAMEAQCNQWLKCINQDPFHGGGTVSIISAEHFGLVLNSLIEPLGIKFCAVVVGFTVAVFGCNFTFGYLRAKAYYGWHKERPD